MDMEICMIHYQGKLKETEIFMILLNIKVG